jgi:hypothetical protein
MLWADTASGLLKQRNAADSAWINILTLSTGAASGSLPLTGGTMGGTIQNFTSAGINDDASVTAITIDASENVGIGVVPEAWHSTAYALQIGLDTALYDAGGYTILSNNMYFDAANKYISTDEASRYQQVNGTHTFQVAASGTADTAITWTDALEITNDGRGLSEFTAKAWLNFVGTGTIAIADSHNISGIADNGTGDYSVNIAVDMANVNYTVVGMGSADGIAGMTVDNRVNVDLAVGGYRITTRKTADAALVDATLVMTQVFGD